MHGQLVECRKSPLHQHPRRGRACPWCAVEKRHDGRGLFTPVPPRRRWWRPSFSLPSIPRPAWNWPSLPSLPRVRLQNPFPNTMGSVGKFAVCILPLLLVVAFLAVTRPFARELTLTYANSPIGAILAFAVGYAVGYRRTPSTFLGLLGLSIAVPIAMALNMNPILALFIGLNLAVGFGFARAAPAVLDLCRRLAPTKRQLHLILAGASSLVLVRDARRPPGQRHVSRRDLHQHRLRDRRYVWMLIGYKVGRSPRIAKTRTWLMVILAAWPIGITFQMTPAEAGYFVFAVATGFLLGRRTRI